MYLIAGAPAALEDINNPDWAPNILMGYSSTLLSSTNTRPRAERAHKKRRQLTECTLNAAEEFDDELAGNPSDSVDHCNVRSFGMQTDLSMSDLDKLTTVNRDLTSEIAILKSTVKNCIISKETFEGDDERTLYYIGIPSYQTLLVIYDLVSPHLSETHRSALTNFQQFVLCLMRLRCIY